MTHGITVSSLPFFLSSTTMEKKKNASHSLCSSFAHFYLFGINILVGIVYQQTINGQLEQSTNSRQSVSYW